DLVARHGHAEIAAADANHRPPGFVSMKNRDRLAGRVFSRVHALGPDAAKAVPLRKKVERGAVRRPSRLIIRCAVRYSDPLAINPAFRNGAAKIREPPAPWALKATH